MRQFLSGLSRSRALLFVAYLAAAFAVLGANPFRGESITPLDALVKQHAFAWADLGMEVKHGERSDILNGLLPSWIEARRQIRTGQIPLWNDVLAGGSTYLTPAYSTFTPAFAMFVAAPTPALGFHLAIILNLGIAGLGMHLFLRRHVGGMAAACGAVTFMFCGFHTAWLYWPHVHTAIWAPWLLLAIDRCVEWPRMRNAVGIGLATMMVVLGGFPFVAEMILCMGGLYFLVSWAHRFRDTDIRLKALPWYVAGSLLGLLICAPLLIELANWLQHYDLGYRENRGSYLNLSHANRLLPPWSYEFKRVEQTMYVGLAMTVCAAATLLVSLARPTRIARIGTFGILLLIISAGLVFGLWPMWLVGWFPGMSFNSWSRTIGLLDISIILLGTLAIDRLWKVSRAVSDSGIRSVGLQSLVVVLILAQTAEQTHFFRRYNGATYASYFFPEVPAVEYVRSRVGPFDHVIGDSSFGIAGELGAFELRDWFAHQLRTPAHREALVEMVPKHSRSHTASRFRASGIKTGSQALTDFNVRYLIVHSHDRDTTGPARRKITSKVPLPQQPGDNWIQFFDVSEENGLLLRGISVRMATYMQKGIRGTVRLDLVSPSGAAVRESRIDARTVMDNHLAEFYFTEPVRLEPGRYRFVITYEPLERPARPLTAWVLPRVVEHADASLFVGTSMHEGEMEYLLHVNESVRGNYRRVYTAAGLSVFESTRTPNGPYFLRDLNENADPYASSSVEVEHYLPHSFNLRYSGNDSGFVVVPTFITSNWKITLNGSTVVPSLKKGVMPAVPVTGPADIAFEYVPWSARTLLAWTGSLLGLVGLMTLLERYFRKRERKDYKAHRRRRDT